VERGHLLQHLPGVRQTGHLLRTQQVADGDYVVERDRHASAGQRVPHVQRVAQDDQPGGPVGRGRQEGVGHGPQLALLDGRQDRRLHALGQGRQHVVPQVGFHAAVLDGRGGEVLGDVDEDPRLVGSDLVQQDGGPVAQHDVAVVGQGQLRVDQLEAVELGLDLGGVRVVLLAELGGVAVGDDGEVAEVGVLLRAIGDALDAQDFVGLRGGDEGGRGGLDDGDMGLGHGGGAQLHDEAAVVKGAALGRGRRGAVGLGVGDGHLLAVEDDIVAGDGDGVDVLETVAEAELLEGADAAGLQQLADDAVGLLERALQQQHAASLSAQGHGQRAAQDACSDDDHVGLVVDAPALLGLVARFRDGGLLVSLDGGDGDGGRHWGGRRQRRAGNGLDTSEEQRTLAHILLERMMGDEKRRKEEEEEEEEEPLSARWREDRQRRM